MRSYLWHAAQTWVYTWWPRRTLWRQHNTDCGERPGPSNCGGRALPFLHETAPHSSNDGNTYNHNIPLGIQGAKHALVLPWVLSGRDVVIAGKRNSTNKQCRWGSNLNSGQRLTLHETNITRSHHVNDSTGRGGRWIGDKCTDSQAHAHHRTAPSQARQPQTHS